ncbi:alpha/beta hydrolase [Pseudomonas aeruginosa]|nr:alpha/beta hydrolase [Pseudomonas aeruginosa]EIU2673193.1 alpha/beta hydrolase [Pseudomonas aeruginosa]EIU2723022.1 alpha/beta hydrolase [Pseudomonas aeruginosa]EIU3319031.1 alpha/beta hydrolase [Pseudomonas aeruginosa]EIU3437553.1 alpha/beta hydrolase [Pseudomonas aeruginosa]
MKSVTFKNCTWDVAATLRLPEGFDERKKYAAVICGHPISSCKEQTSGAIYGEALTNEGFITLAFDASTQGASGGEPKFLEDPGMRVEDFRCAVDYLVTLPYVDEEKIGVLGVCGGGAYAANVAMTEKRIKAVGTVVATNFGRLMRDGDMSPDAALNTLEAIGKQRTAEARGGDPMIVGYIPFANHAEREAAGVEDVDMVNAVDYYLTQRGQKPGSPNKLRFTSTGAVLGWDAFHLAEKLLTQPLHVVFGDVPGAFGSFSDGHELYRRARSSQKSIQIVPGASHYDFYDQPAATSQAVEQLVPFYKKHLSA